MISVYINQLPFQSSGTLAFHLLCYVLLTRPGSQVKGEAHHCVTHLLITRNVAGFLFAQTSVKTSSGYISSAFVFSDLEPKYCVLLLLLLLRLQLLFLMLAGEAQEISWSISSLTSQPQRTCTRVASTKSCHTIFTFLYFVHSILNCLTTVFFFLPQCNAIFYK